MQNYARVFALYFNFVRIHYTILATAGGGEKNSQR